LERLDVVDERRIQLVEGHDGQSIRMRPPRAT
jgi:hypothetical protein